MVARERNLSFDLESGQKTIEEEGLWDAVTGVGHTTKPLGRVWSGFLSLDRLVKDEDGLTSCDSSNSCDKLSKYSEVAIGSVEVVEDKMLRGEENLGLLEKCTVSDKPKKKHSKKPPKPPRPPKSLVLDAADKKLVSKISELAMLKRARNERMKALRKMKATKASSSSGSLFAMAVTILFLLVIILQAM